MKGRTQLADRPQPEYPRIVAAGAVSAVVFGGVQHLRAGSVTSIPVDPGQDVRDPAEVGNLGDIDGLRPIRQLGSSFHPTPAGMRAVADLLIGRLTDPAPQRD